MCSDPSSLFRTLVPEFSVVLDASETDNFEFPVLQKNCVAVNFPSGKMGAKHGFANRGSLARATGVNDLSSLLASSVDLVLHSVDGTSERAAVEA